MLSRIIHKFLFTVNYVFMLFNKHTSNSTWDIFNHQIFNFVWLPSIGMCPPPFPLVPLPYSSFSSSSTLPSSPSPPSPSFPFLSSLPHFPSYFLHYPLPLVFPLNPPFQFHSPFPPSLPSNILLGVTRLRQSIRHSMCLLQSAEP